MIVRELFVLITVNEVALMILSALNGITLFIIATKAELSNVKIVTDNLSSS